MSDKVAAQSLLFLFTFFLPLYFPIILLFCFSFFLCFSRPYVTFLRCLDVKPLSLTHSLTHSLKGVCIIVRNHIYYSEQNISHVFPTITECAEHEIIKSNAKYIK